MIRDVKPLELKQYLDEQEGSPTLLDVREPWEFERCHIKGSQHIPMGQIQARVHELDPNREIVVICHHGIRSFHVARFLVNQGFTEVINLRGGVDGWAKEVDSTMPLY